MVYQLQVNVRVFGGNLAGLAPGNVCCRPFVPTCRNTVVSCLIVSGKWCSCRLAPETCKRIQKFNQGSLVALGAGYLACGLRAVLWCSCVFYVWMGVFYAWMGIPFLIRRSYNSPESISTSPRFFFFHCTFTDDALP